VLPKVGIFVIPCAFSRMSADKKENPDTPARPHLVPELEQVSSSPSPLKPSYLIGIYVPQFCKLLSGRDL
jgi:hypothetical protein